MRPVTRVRAARVIALGLLAALLLAPPAAAQTGSPSPRSPVVEGQVAGSGDPGGLLSIRVDASFPGGWDGLHLVEVVLRAGGQELDHLTYDIEDAKVSLNERSLVAGTGASATGQYLGVSGSKVVVTTGGANLTFRLDAEVLRAIPEDARFALSVTGDLGERAEVVRELAAAPSAGLTWTTVVAAVVIALLAGGFVGNIFASRRRPPPRLSVYASVQRRLESERTRPGNS